MILSEDLMAKLAKCEKLNMVTDHIMVPTFIDDLVNALEVLIRKKKKEYFMLSEVRIVTPYQAALKIAKDFDLDELIDFKNNQERIFCRQSSKALLS